MKWMTPTLVALASALTTLAAAPAASVTASPKRPISIAAASSA